MLVPQFIPGYDLTEIIYEGIHTVIYRGLSLQNQQRVILKILKADAPCLEAIASLLHEYETVAHLDLPGIVKVLKKETYKNRLAIVFEDFGGQSLKELLNATQLDLVTFLNIAIQLSQALADLHSHHIIHKDVKPGNIIINPTTGIVKLTDFSIASQLDSETTQAINTNQLEGTLAYMSPEQTGRMNRTIDYRSDFYSLGVTLYEILVGELPFKSNDPLELVYCHIAQLPPAVEQLKPQIPSAISAIVMKLMAKNAEDRYQNALGLKADLEFIAAHLHNIKLMTSFKPGECDRAPDLLIPQKLYGREEEVLNILAAFNRVAGDTEEEEAQHRIHNPKSKVEMILVSGYSGIGKSSLVNEVQKPILRQRGHFISGKFDQFQRNIPYAAIIQAFQSLIQFLLLEDAVSLQRWREKLQAALGDNGQIIVDLIPEVELIIGKQPKVQQLGLTEAQNHFHLVFQKFLHVFTQKEHPLVIFLDDLQWADIASLKLMQLSLADPDSQYLLLIGAYRDNEVSPYHPLMQTVEEIQKAGAIINHIAVKPLDLACVNQLLCDTLDCTESPQIQELASLLFNKTAGNPFFMTQVLKTLQQEMLLVFDLIQKQWQWSIEQIQTVGITDLGVVELMARNISQLPKETQDTLTYAACIGDRFKLDVLAIITQKSIREVAENLWIALQQGFILPLNKDYKVPLLFRESELKQFDFDESRLEYRFLHDRVQQAVYSLIPNRQKQATHRKIGQLLLSKTPKEQLQENIFDIVNQLNAGLTAFRERVEQDELVQLNLIAGQKAKASAAYEPAVKYLRTAMELLTADSWNTHHDLTLGLYKERAEVEFINGDFDKAETLIHTALTQTKSSLHKSDLYRLLVLQYTLQSKYDAAVEAAKKGLHLLEIPLPEENLTAVVKDEILEVEKKLHNQDIASIVNKPQILLEDKKLAIKLLIAVEPATIIKSNLDLFVIVCLKAVNLSLKYGNIPESVKAYCSYGMILGCFFEDYSSGYEFGLHALELGAKFNDKAQICKASFTLGSFIYCWSKHIKGAANINYDGYQAGLESGELLFGGYNLFSKICNLFFQGLELKSILSEISVCLSFTKQIKHIFGSETILAVKLAILDLLDNELEQKDSQISESKFLAQCQQNKNLFALGVYFICKSQSSYLKNQFETALDYMKLSEDSLQSMVGFAISSEYYFYLSLILANLSKKGTGNGERGTGVFLRSKNIHVRPFQFPVLRGSKTPSSTSCSFRLGFKSPYVTVCSLFPVPRSLLISTVDGNEKAKYLEQLQKNQQQMKIWADNCPENFLHRYLLVEAEIARITGKDLEAIDLYDRAIESAREQEFIQNEALALELAAKFWLSKGKQEIIKLYMTTAYQCYMKWGATVKVQQLETQYSYLTVKASTLISKDSTITTTSTSINASLTFDMLTVVKASQALSGEIVLECLLKKLMHLVRENAGAQKVFFLNKKNNQLFLEAFLSEDNEAMVCQSKSINACNLLPKNLITYVQRTHVPLVLDNASQNQQFNSDPYIATHQPKSILVLPILHQSNIVGILYLENNLTKGAFSQDRVEVLHILAAQAAISLENANFYNTLEIKVAQRTQELQNTLEELRRTQLQMIQNEKMSSLGQLVAGIAHEINNPINFIYGNLNHVAEYTQSLLRLVDIYLENPLISLSEILGKAEEIDIEYIRVDLPKLLTSLRTGASRIRDIVQSLRNFSRLDEAALKAVDIHQGIDNTLMILSSKLESIQVINEYAKLPLVQCYAAELNQVFMYVLTNAIDAIEEAFILGDRLLRKEKGQIRIRTELRQDNQVAICIADNGVGMTAEVQNKMCDPFFTTKPVGKGNGLGLSITYQIVVEKHGGHLICQSLPGEGTEFTILLPHR
ncbi:AAA family ATPase [Scytonema sp. UIC 10036]|uniref:ATP-binding sensor histidine kinase n=1 Tax=Scytonema sp. UIC 10036 TaxID=2304196 RepID=UPI0012DADFCC|nr:ATP-binding sensor histidine kinase [Scytonema sp. UIC 10036]MUG95649.1 AAA family ATPase [Scytonema sp. UIC 10036]